MIFYAKDTSKKVRAIKRAQGQAGEHLTKPPYGYMVSPTDKKQWIVDEEAAAVVKRIFDLCIGGKGPMQIAKILKEDKVPTAKAYYAEKKGKHFPKIRTTGKTARLSAFWSVWTIADIP